MYKIRSLLVWLLSACPLLLTGQTTSTGHNQRNSYRETNRFYSSPARPVSGNRPKARLQRFGGGPKGEPALPDGPANPKPVAVADQPPGVSVRRRKLRLRER